MNLYYNSILLLLKRLGYLTVAYTLCRLLFLFFQWNSFTNIGVLSFIGGLRFDLSAIFYTNALIIVLHTVPGNFKYNRNYQKGLEILFFVVNLLFLSTNFIDFIYYNFTGKRSTYGLITASGMEQEIGGLLPSFIKSYWYVFLFFILFGFLFWKFIPKHTFNKPNNFSSSKNYIFQLLIFLCSVGSCILIGRGGFQKKPLKRVDAIKYTSPNNTPIVLNTPFCILKTIGKKKELKEHSFFKPTKLNKLYSPVKHYKNNKGLQKKNIVLIIVESYGDENVSFSNKKTGNTPFLDSLITQSLYFKNGFANGRVSIDAVPSTISGIPSIIGEPYIASTYAFNNVNTLPKILKQEGYNTSFFHGAFNGSQNFDQYSSIAGFDKYYGKDQYPDNNPEHDDGKWGIFDEEFLQFFGKELNTFKEPFFSSVFTISSHVPFIMPKKHLNNFKKGNTRFYQTVGYTDYSLKKFFNYAKTQKWYKNTLFVITADHCSSVNHGKYKSKLEEYEIPIILFDPNNNNLKGVSDKNLQQIDILPSILDYLGYNKKFISFGNSYKNDENLIINYVNNVYHVVIDDYYFIFDGKKIIELYNFKTDPYVKNNLLNNSKEVIKKLETHIKAYLQSFNHRTINNSLSIK
ncbi:LTA synthase family protein [Pseudofulvibacter geojedonensis]|uniref:LTA synthase family protein n=1 Tax=Pseudofulvibacter geojedonensis TaxID=1123758 RepID=A0ABW3HZL6_9FLAO